MVGRELRGSGSTQRRCRLDGARWVFIGLKRGGCERSPGASLGCGVGSAFHLERGHWPLRTEAVQSIS